MAPISAPRILATSTFSRLFLLLSLSVLMHCNSSQATQPPQITEMVLYFQDFGAGPSATLIPFRTVFITNNFITETTDPNSPMVGRGQGMYVTSALDGSSTHAMFSIVVTNQPYNGSTLEIQGTAKQFEAVRKYSVVGGTGKFLFARGYTTFETISVDMPQAHSVIQCNVTIRLG
ncbi:hypothetical protein ACJRO7_001658 [Eucalyptus globulus]|uniref:Dirigent protein n=1 Tax=Eucalyptus globulus TaxID=34317 RepID=A0ABD3LRQ8_EUCGL